MRQVAVELAHRLLAPRTVFVLGSRSEKGEANLIPVTNVTSVCVEPQIVGVSVFNEWRTCRNLRTSAGFTLSLPDISQAELVWRLGAKYSGYHRVSTLPGALEFPQELSYAFSQYGPVLREANSWIECRTHRVVDGLGDHTLFLALVTSAATGARPRPPTLMQWSGNVFGTTGREFELDYFPERR